MSPEEVHLWERFEATRSIEDRNRLVELFQPLLGKIAFNRLQRIPSTAGVEYGDLVNDGIPALIQCIERFERSRGFEFSTFASARLGGALFDALRDRDWVPRLERKKAKTEAIRIATIKAASESPVFEKTPCRKAADGIEENDFWHDACRSLNKTEKLIVLMYFRAGIPMREIGNSLQLSESRISQMLSKLMERLRSNERLLEVLMVA